MAAHRRIGSFCFGTCGLHVSIAVTPHLQDRLLYRSQACAIRDCVLEPTLMTFIGSMPGISGRGVPAYWLRSSLSARLLYAVRRLRRVQEGGESRGDHARDRPNSAVHNSIIVSRGGFKNSSAAQQQCDECF